MSYSQYKLRRRTLRRRTLRRFIAACFIVVMLSLWAWIKIDERASRNVYERNRVGVTGALNSYRLPKGD